jgi:hypothetical protein
MPLIQGRAFNSEQAIPMARRGRALSLKRSGPAAKRSRPADTAGRKGSVKRTTKATDIEVAVNLDGKGTS